MSKRTPVTTARTFLVATTLSLGLGACDVDDLDAVRPDDASEDAVAAAALALDGGVLDRLGAEFHVLDAATAGPTGGAMNPEDARQRVSGVDAVGIDLNELDRDALADYAPLSRAAMELGVPLIVENIDDPEALAALIGIGVQADVAVVTTLGTNRYRVRVYGGDVEGASTFEGSGSEVGVVEWSADTLTLAVEETGEALRHAASTHLQSAPTPSQVPTSGYLYYDFDTAEESFSPITGQTASLSMDFEAELALDTDRAKKVVFFRPIGSGQHPGTLISDSTSNRGYYQESQKVSLTPNNTSVSLYAHAPSTANASTTYTSTTGWTIGSESGWPAIGYSSSDAVSTTLTDFSMVNNTANSTASWTFEMTTDWDDLFYHPAFEKCKVKSLPNLAKSNLNPEYEALYRTDETFTSSVTFAFSKVTVLRRIWRGGDIFTCKKYSNEWTLTRNRNVSINFGAV